MSTSLAYFGTLVSPWTHFGHARICQMAETHGIDLVFTPVDYSVIFPATGGLPLAKRAPARQAYRMLELRRWRDELNIPINIEPKYFPVSSDAAGLVALTLTENKLSNLTFAGACMRATWEEERDISSRETLVEIANECGLDGPRILEQSEAPHIKEIYDTVTRDAIAKGVFGAPSYVVDGEVFWGQDRLSLVEKKLRNEAAA
jgi:carboxymethylenebutenolidase